MMEISNLCCAARICKQKKFSMKEEGTHYLWYLKYRMVCR